MGIPRLPVVVFLLSAAAFGPADAFGRSFTTVFPAAESVVSESGAWLSGARDGIDWGDISATTGKTHPHPGPARYADATALLAGTWGPDQGAEGKVWTGDPHNYPEVELRLRSTLSAHVCNGYEITFSLAPNAYLIIVRWNGPLGDFTYLANLSGSQYQVKAGDAVKATIVGHVITAYKNGVKMGQAIDSVYATGKPGMGFNEQENGDYGYTEFTATDGSGTLIRPLLPRPVATGAGNEAFPWRDVLGRSSPGPAMTFSQKRLPVSK
jgi:hypothetical protein